MDILERSERSEGSKRERERLERLERMESHRDRESRHDRKERSTGDRVLEDLRERYIKILYLYFQKSIVLNKAIFYVQIFNL